MSHKADNGSESYRIPAWSFMFSLFLPPKIASAVRKYGDVTIFDASASFLSLPAAGRLKKRRPKKLSGRLKKRRPKKRIKVNFGLLFGTNTRKDDEILSDFSKGMIIRFFYRRKSPLPYACTATWRFSTLLHLFYLSPTRVGWKHRSIRICGIRKSEGLRFFCRTLV